MVKRLYTYDDILKLPDFIRVELIDGIICTDDWTDLEIDEDIFQNPPSEDHHVTYRQKVAVPAAGEYYFVIWENNRN